jgi:hypothetical protein
MIDMVIEFSEVGDYDRLPSYHAMIIGATDPLQRRSYHQTQWPLPMEGAVSLTGDVPGLTKISPNDDF